MWAVIREFCEVVNPLVCLLIWCEINGFYNISRWLGIHLVGWRKKLLPRRVDRYPWRIPYPNPVMEINPWKKNITPSLNYEVIEPVVYPVITDKFALVFLIFVVERFGRLYWFCEGIKVHHWKDIKEKMTVLDSTGGLKVKIKAKVDKWGFVQVNTEPEMDTI